MQYGGDPNIASVQDTSESSAHQQSVGGGFGASMGGASGSFSYSRGNASGYGADINPDTALSFSFASARATRS